MSFDEWWEKKFLAEKHADGKSHEDVTRSYTLSVYREVANRAWKAGQIALTMSYCRHMTNEEKEHFEKQL